MTTPAIQDLYPDDFAHCFGCGNKNATGHKLKSYVDGEETIANFMPAPEQTAVPGFVYGGLIASLIDCHAMATAAAAAERAAGRKIGDGPAPRFVTAEFRVTFAKPTPIGTELSLRARVTERNDRKAIIDIMLSADGVVTARGEAIAVRMPESMKADKTV